jgi:hypothetical protein
VSTTAVPTGRPAAARPAIPAGPACVRPKGTVMATR